MNLHIVPDNVFVNRFYENLQELGLLEKNRIIVRTKKTALKVVRYPLPFAPLYSSQFRSLVGDTLQYNKVFVHFFTPLLYRWVAKNNFKELNWMIWGGDLYNLSSADQMCYEPLTFQKYVRWHWSPTEFLYSLKVLLTNNVFRRKAYSKVSNILTWMYQEYKFSCDHLQMKATHKFFFYENQMPYASLNEKRSKVGYVPQKPSLIIGNSASPTNNHLDTIEFLEKSQVQANLLVPVSYGDQAYTRFLKKNLRYSGGEITFIDRYMGFDEYLSFLASSDALLMNTVRPQGFGNIFMMLCLGKSVFFNEKNISLPDLTAHGIKWYPLSDIVSFSVHHAGKSNSDAVVKLLSHDSLMESYGKLFI
jgi:dTDP-N-acetylfucosamine:lipid II N-acetylfucosaminyltransferase